MGNVVSSQERRYQVGDGVSFFIVRSEQEGVQVSFFVGEARFLVSKDFWFILFRVRRFKVCIFSLGLFQGRQLFIIGLVQLIQGILEIIFLKCRGLGLEFFSIKSYYFWGIERGRVVEREFVLFFVDFRFFFLYQVLWFRFIDFQSRESREKLLSLIFVIKMGKFSEWSQTLEFIAQVSGRVRIRVFIFMFSLGLFLFLF